MSDVKMMLWPIFVVCFVPFASAVPPTWLQCGKSKYKDAGDYELPSPSIVGGIEARPHEFPWQVSLQRKPSGSQFCGASVINEKWVLTAAHCTSGKNPSTLQLVFGEHIKNDANETHRQTIYVEKIVNHPKYGSPSRLSHDFSLLKTQTSIQLNENVWPACAPKPKDTYVNKKAVVSGWGTTSSGGVGSKTLRYTTLNITTNKYCQSVYVNNQITDDMICATDNKNSTERDSCQGDSGGPLVVKDSKGIFSLVGVVSWGIGCASKYPGVYSRVNYVLDWINETISK